jgi:hypothetical protein
VQHGLKRSSAGSGLCFWRKCIVVSTAAATQQITSPVAGQADILVAPDLEAGALLLKQLE